MILRSPKKLSIFPFFLQTAYAGIYILIAFLNVNYFP